ncbi:MAG: hypothetical protein IJ039_01130 [Clostridia bacterium]|nr:hypothetical protein [Clostridia bacterium]
MKNYNIINYKVNKNVKPIDIFQNLEFLIQTHNFTFSECLIKLEVSIVEFEHEGKLHSNRNKNAILTILKHYPMLNDFFEHKSYIDDDGFAKEILTIKNFTEDTFSSCGKVEYSMIKEIVEKIPRPYSVNALEIIFNGIDFGSSVHPLCKMKPAPSGFGSPIGSYISYSRTNYGSEKHSYIQFATDDENYESMRSMFFEFAENISGKYEGTESHS